jgi:hypothetical protein
MPNFHPRIAVSTWSLHRKIGILFPHDLDRFAAGPRTERWGAGTLKLIDVPQAVADHGIGRVEVCSFHLESLETAYLEELRAAFAAAGVTLQTLLLEEGDLSHAGTHARDRDWMLRWVDIAAMLGAGAMRVIAGKQAAAPETLALASAGLNKLGLAAGAAGVRLVTENWFDLLSTPEVTLQVLDATEGTVGLLVDLGNWPRPRKYDDLPKIFSRGELCHAKADFSSGSLDTEDYGKTIGIGEASGYRGPYTLIFDADTPDEWDGIGIEREFVAARIAPQEAFE